MKVQITGTFTGSIIFIIKSGDAGARLHAPSVAESRRQGGKLEFLSKANSRDGRMNREKDRTESARCVVKLENGSARGK